METENRQGSIGDEAFEVRRRHFAVERELASRLKAAPRERRPEIYRTMYAELLARVPEHARLTVRVSPAQLEVGLRRQMRMVEPHLHGQADVVEFAPGTCRFAYRMSERARTVVGVDISDQRTGDTPAPRNFRHVTYDGYRLDLPGECADLVYSNQFVEHIHPDDVRMHFRLARRLLRSGGCYVFSTPHVFMGPWDVSRGFSETAEGFHLKEWTFRELRDVLRETGFAASTPMIWVKGRPTPIPMHGAYLSLEDVVGKLGSGMRRRLSRYLFTQIIFTAVKTGD